IATGFDDGPVQHAADAAKKEREPEKAHGLFSAASEMAGATTTNEQPAAGKPKEEDPFDSIFKIFNSK
ncbi:MAG: hypothetical protein RR743_07620, partial [Oscillospiraceae bacterium]